MSKRLPLLFTAALALSGLVQARAPRETVDAVAAAIEANYFDAARGAAIAHDLRAASARGEFDAQSAPLDLATALTDTLKPVDRHFNVRWSAPEDTGNARRPSPGSSRDTGVKRAEILPGNIGYLELSFFAGFDFADHDAPPRRAIDAALQMLAWSDALIIDLRNNGGGSPAMVGYLTSAFTPKGADIYNTFHSRTGTSSEAPRESHPSPRLDVPVYVLVSARTGSAAEALAYTLQSARRATIVGEATAGAANPGGPVDVGEGFSVFVSDGSPINPITGRNWEGDGVAPEVAVESSQALRVAQVHALERMFASDTSETPRTAARWVLEALQAHDLRAVGSTTALQGSFGEVVVRADAEALTMKQGRRPARVLQPLPSGDWFVADDPTRRVAFERDDAGRVIALQLRFADGNLSRHRRTD